MTVTSGRKCLESYKSSSPLGYLVRMCLESSIWRSTRCLLTWKTSVTPGKRFLFRLAVSMPRTNGIESQFWPTPKASSPLGGCSGARKTLQRMKEKGMITPEECRMFGSGLGGKINPALLEWLMGYEEQFTKLIPTPTATDYRGGCLSRYWRPGSQNVQVEREREREPEARVRRSAEKPCGSHSPWEAWPTEPGVGRVADGVSNRVDRIRCLGNAVVPQQFYIFFKLIHDIEERGENP